MSYQYTEVLRKSFELSKARTARECANANSMLEEAGLIGRTVLLDYSPDSQALLHPSNQNSPSRQIYANLLKFGLSSDAQTPVVILEDIRGSYFGSAALSMQGAEIYDVRDELSDSKVARQLEECLKQHIFRLEEFVELCSEVPTDPFELKMFEAFINSISTPAGVLSYLFLRSYGYISPPLSLPIDRRSIFALEALKISSGVIPIVQGEHIGDDPNRIYLDRRIFGYEIAATD